MALSFRILHTSNLFFRNITKPVKWSVRKHCPVRLFCNGVRYQNSILDRPLLVGKECRILARPVRQCTIQSGDPKTPQEPEKKPGLIQRFKQMYKDYWYVLLPVHMTTSAIWFGGFYYCVSSGVDVVNLMESMGISEKLLTPLRETGAGYFALALACYKLITPLRYAVTVGATTYAINRLTAFGWIKPVPSRTRLKEMLQERKDNIQDRFQESKQHYQTQIQERKTQVMDEMQRYKTEMKNIKNRVKKM
ncbi:uncharacterized protein C18orf19 homolog A [Maniola hyperantus]|uniref:uncharacterized protein C18orf19 homolog A n=1 Tax=Aphantopus hyperantus TaxID=2795564 RepID=UPI00156848FD|nr:uncharacterized protein C18orf19 homolog A [Maniola hyperantus]